MRLLGVIVGLVLCLCGAGIMASAIEGGDAAGLLVGGAFALAFIASGVAVCVGAWRGL